MDELNNFQPGELHNSLKNIGHDASTNKDKLEIAIALLKSGIPMHQIPIDDTEQLTKLYNERILNITQDSFSEQDNNVLRRLLSMKKYKKLSSIIQSIDYKGHNDLADELENISNIIISYELSQPKYAFVPEFDDQNVKYLAGEPQMVDQQQMLEPEISDEDIEDVVTPKDISDLLDKLQTVLDVSDEFDPDLLPIAKKILKEILEKFDKIETVSPEGEIAPESPDLEQAPLNTPAIANILKSTIKLAQTAEILENSNYSGISNEIDSIISDVQKLVNKIK